MLGIRRGLSLSGGLGVGAGLALAGGANYLLRDTFTGADSTALGSHTADTGQSWVVHSGTWVLSSNQLVETGFGPVYATADAGAADLSITADLTVPSSSGTGLVFRFSDTSNFWFAWLDLSAKQFRLYRTQAGSATLIVGVSVPSIAADVTYSVNVRCIGQLITATLDGGDTYRLQYDAATFNEAATRVGFRAIAQNTVYDNLRVRTAALDAPSADRWSGATNAASALALPSYDGDTQGTHPDVIDFGSGNTWNSYRYWMAYTPHTDGNSAFENPSILASADGDTWVVPDGLTNPIDAWPGSGRLNSDTDLVYVDDTLYCFYRESDSSTEDIVLYRTSTDGVTWSSEQTALAGAFTTLLSPSLIYRNGTWQMYVVDALNTGSNKNVIKRYTSTDLSTWSDPVWCAYVNPASRDVWHINVNYDNGEYRGLFNAGDAGTNATDGVLYMATSYDGLNWSISTDPVLEPSTSVGAWDESKLYRSAMCLTATGYDLWYAAVSVAGEWHIGTATLTES